MNIFLFQCYLLLQVWDENHMVGIIYVVVPLYYDTEITDRNCRNHCYPSMIMILYATFFLTLQNLIYSHDVSNAAL